LEVTQAKNRLASCRKILSVWRKCRIRDNQSGGEKSMHSHGTHKLAQRLRPICYAGLGGVSLARHREKETVSLGGRKDDIDASISAKRPAANLGVSKP